MNDDESQGATSITVLVPASTMMAAEYLYREGNAKRFDDWMSEHSEVQQKAILALLERKYGPQS